MLKKVYLLIIIGGIIALTSCNDNSTGSNNLKAINEINISNIKKVYNVLQGNKLQIKPDLKFTKDGIGNEKRYKYEWLALLGKSFEDTLATTRNLNISIGLNPGIYDVYYRVKDLKTGIRWKKTFNLHVSSSTSKGWLVLSGVNSTARLDMISFIKDEYKPIYSILDYVKSDLHLKGKPVDISSFSIPFNPYQIYVTSEGTGTTRIKPNSFGWSPKLLIKNSFYTDVSDDYIADIIVPTTGSTIFIYMDGNLYYNRYDKFGNPINILKGTTETFKMAPFIGINYGFRGKNDIIYDETHDRFVQHVYRKDYVVKMPEGSLFDYDDTEMNMVFMTGSRYKGGEIFAILNDPNTSIYHLARIDGATFKQLSWEEMNAPDIGNANHFAVNPIFGYIFYSVEGRVYEYDVGTNKTKLMLDKSPKKVTWLGFPRRDNLIVGTYDPSLPADSCGIFEMYSVPPINKQIVLEEKYTGFGKIKDIDYRMR